MCLVRIPQYTCEAMHKSVEYSIRLFQQSLEVALDSQLWYCPVSFLHIGFTRGITLKQDDL